MHVLEIGPCDCGSEIFLIAPHQDDETLGCGGTIIKKRKDGARLKIVFITDGRKSHRKIMPEDEMAVIRENEALKAAEKLGIEKDDVCFLRFQSGRLEKSFSSAVEKVYTLLDDMRPTSIFVPYLRDSHTEHILTNQILLKAFWLNNKRTIVYEYPVWFWNNWPWTFDQQKNPIYSLKYVWKGMMSFFFMIKEFKYGLYVLDVMHIKKEALYLHESQTKKLKISPEWPILSDVSNVEFLKCFFQKYEIFKKIEFLPESKGH